jgi:hypothetical protein
MTKKQIQKHDTQPQALSTGMAAEQALAVAKVQAALTIAQARPRDQHASTARILEACRRKKLAEKATYAYKRGDTMIQAPSLDLVQMVATHWGNIKFGFREVGAGPDYTEVEAYAWDLETNTEATRLFRVHRSRRYMVDDQKQSNLRSERDRYENMASVAQRRVRACIEQVIPDDIFDQAVDECQKTLQREDPRSREEKIEEMVIAFDKISVTKKQLETYLGHPVRGAVEAQLNSLRRVYQSIRDGLSQREDHFKTDTDTDTDTDTGPEPTDRTKPSMDADESNSDTDSDALNEMYALAEELWGKSAGAQLPKACKKEGIILAEIKSNEVSIMIDILNQRLEDANA